LANIRISGGEKVPVLSIYDFESVRQYSEERDINWIDMAMKELYDIA
jgi:hypothetical protein